MVRCGEVKKEITEYKMKSNENLPDDIIQHILQYDNHFIVKNGKIKDVTKLKINDERYEILENVFRKTSIQEKVYDDYENESSYIIRFSLSENKNYSIIYDSLNDLRYVHFIEFFKNISEKTSNDIYQTHRTSILIEDY